MEKRSKEVLVIQERESINTFEELFQHPLLKGKTLYIDLWVTWCCPCKAELQNRIKLHDELESIGATPVYISLDRDNAAEKWEKMIYGSPLNGVNIRFSKNFNSFISENLPNFVGIPRYLIVNSRGEITDWNALRPSDGKLLLNALKEAVKI